MKTFDSLPRSDPQRGSLHLEWKRCGKADCRCGGGALHGPYWYRHFREDGRQRKQYVPVQRVAFELELQADRRRQHAATRSMANTLSELRRLEKEVRS